MLKIKNNANSTVIQKFHNNTTQPVFSNEQIKLDETTTTRMLNINCDQRVEVLNELYLNSKILEAIAKKGSKQNTDSAILKIIAHPEIQNDNNNTPDLDLATPMSSTPASPTTTITLPTWSSPEHLDRLNDIKNASNQDEIVPDCVAELQVKQENQELTLLNEDIRQHNEKMKANMTNGITKQQQEESIQRSQKLLQENKTHVIDEQECEKVIKLSSNQEEQLAELIKMTPFQIVKKVLKEQFGHWMEYGLIIGVVGGSAALAYYMLSRKEKKIFNTMKILCTPLIVKTNNVVTKTATWSSNLMEKIKNFFK